MMAKAHMTFRIRRAEIFPAHTKIIKICNSLLERNVRIVVATRIELSHVFIKCFIFFNFF
jgi:hypothetical protein